MVIQIALGIMLGFVFLALVAFGGLVIYIYCSKRETIIRTRKRYDFDENYDVKDWFEEEDDWYE